MKSQNLKSALMLTAVLAMAAVFTACKNNGNEPANIDLPAQFANVEIADTGGSQTIQFSATADWTVTVKDETRGTEWLTVSPTSGKAGSNISLTLTVQPNTTGTELSATVTITAGEAQKSFTVNSHPATVHTVYVCGMDMYQAAYWKDGEKTVLHSSGATWSSSSAQSIFVANNKVYVCGTITYSQYNYASLWVVDEGTGTITETQLTPDKTSSLAYSVFVSGNDVYVSGYDNRAGYYPVCWKNNVPMALNMGDRTGVFGFAYSVYVSGNDVYVAGTIQTPPVIEAVYWKNSDAPVVLSSSTGGQAGDPANNITANSIYVSGNDVYACGNNETKPVYWKNGVAVQLPGATDAYSIFVYGNDVYVAGAVYGSFQAGYQAVYWKNGVKIALDDINNLGRLVSYTSSIYVKNGDVYIAGYENGQSVYWKNGELIHLPLTSPGTQSSNSATGIFVK